MRKISGGYARAGQLTLMVFFTPFAFSLSYIILTENFTVGGVLFLFFFISIIAFFLWKVFSYADIYLSDDSLVIKKIFSTKKKNIAEIKEVDKALMPFTYYLIFEDKLKIYFTSNASDILKQFFSIDSNKGLNTLKSKF